LVILSFLQRIFGGKEEAMEQAFSIEDAEDFLSKSFDERFQILEKDVSKIYQDMQSAADGMKQSLNDLANAEFKGPVDSELLQNVVGHRRSFIQKMDAMISQVKRPMQPDFDSIMEFSSHSSSAVSEADKKTVNDYQFLHELFNKEAGNTIGKFKALSAMSSKLENFVNKNKESLLSIKNAQNELQLIKDGMKKMAETEGYLKTLEAKLSALNSEHEGEKEKLEKFLGSEEWLRFNELLEKKKKVEEDAASARSQMLQGISKIEKPMRKFKNLVDRGILKFENEKALEKYSSSVFDALVEEKNPEMLYLILKAVQKNISDGKVEMKDREKIMAEIKWLVENNALEAPLEKYLLLAGELEKMERSVSEQKTPDVRRNIERRVEDMERQVERINLEMEKLKKQMERMRDSVNEKKITLESMLASLANKKISINVPL